MQRMVRTRIAPSPTGFPHIGTIYLALFNYIYAKQHNGKFIVRIEDTDRTRFVEGAEKVIYNALSWFNLNPDEDSIKGGKYGPYRQSERLSIYQKYIKELIDKKHAYYCFCTKERLEEMRANQIKNKKPPKYDKCCLSLSEDKVKENLKQEIPYVVRLCVPDNETIKVKDLLMGDIEFSSNDIDDQVLIKSDGFPTYHFAVVVDDYLMKISHVFRGREWMPSTPKHILLYKFFGWDLPVYGHLPLILNSEGKGKLSKRHGHASVDYYINEGYLPEAILNFLSNLVWSNPSGKEIYTLKEFIDKFTFDRLNSQGVLFNLQKLDWMNGEYIRQYKATEFKDKILKFTKGKYTESLIEKTIPIIQERMKKLSDYDKLCDFFINAPKSHEIVLDKYKELFKYIVSYLQDLNTWKATNIGDKLQNIAKEKNIKNSEFFMSVRVAITGKKITPPLNESMEILGKDECIKRLDNI